MHVSFINLILLHLYCQILSTSISVPRYYISCAIYYRDAVHDNATIHVQISRLTRATMEIYSILSRTPCGIGLGSIIILYYYFYYFSFLFIVIIIATPVISDSRTGHKLFSQMRVNTNLNFQLTKSKTI